MRQAILGLATGYNQRQLTPLVRSLKKSGYRGDLWIFVSKGEKRLASWLERNGVRAMEISETPPYNDAFKAASAGLPKEIPGTTPNVRRFFLYQLFLRSLGKDYEQLLLADTRDVVFQKDPFAFPWPDADLFFVEEDSRMHIGDCLGNSTGMKSTFGEKTFEELKSKPISCSGTTWGNFRGISAYVDRMVKIILTKTVEELGIWDQSVHNYILYKDPLPRIHVFGNESGPVLTLHWKPPSTFKIDAEGWMSNDSGSIPNLLHQYDRHPVLVHLVERKYCGLPFYAAQRIRRALQNRAVRLKERFAPQPS